MSNVIYIFAAAAACAAYTATLPPPPWQSQSRGPTSSFEITSYVASVAPLLDASTRRAIATLLASNQPPVQALTLIQAARWRSAVSAATAPWHLAPDDAAGAGAHLAHNLDALGAHLDLTTTATNAPLSLSETLDAMRLLDDLKHRAADPADPLTDLSRYTLLYRLRGAPMTVFWWAQHIFWREDKARSAPLLTFLTDPRNPDEFSRGAAHYFSGLLDDQVRETRARAFSHYLRSVSYKTCLIFIGHAYLNAARILIEMGQRDNALALLSVDVPSIDMTELSAHKHLLAANLLFEALDFTNAVRRLHAACAADPAASNAVVTLASSYYVSTSLWHAAFAQPWCAADRDAALLAGLTNALPTPDDHAFLTALSLDWPPAETLPPHLLTNRILNNAVFPVPRIARSLERSGITATEKQ